MSELALQQSQTNKSQVIRAAENERGKISPAYAQNPIVAQQRAYGNQAVQRMLQAKRLQAKLVINPPDDEYEKEADQVADKVMRMPEPAIQKPASELEKDDEEKRRIQTKLLAVQTTPKIQRNVEMEDEEEPIQTNLLIGNSISPMQRKEAEKEVEVKLLQTKLLQGHSVYVQREAEEKKCPENEEKGLIQSKTISNKTDAIYQDSSIRNLGHGQPLDPSTSAFFETRLGHNFSHVRLHTGPRAEESARSISAKAYTFGGNIAFGAGRYSPNSQEGRWLLAHELTHVIQQGGANSENDSQKLLAHEVAHNAKHKELQNNVIQGGATAPRVRGQPLPDSVRSFMVVSKIKSPQAVQRQKAEDYKDEDALKDAIYLNGLSIADMLPKLANMTAKLDKIKTVAETNMANWKPRVQYAIDVVKNRGHSPEDYIINKQSAFGNIEWDAWEAIYRFLGGQPKSPGDQIEVNGKKGVMYKQEIRIGGPKTWLTNDPGALTTGALEQLKKGGVDVGAYTDEGGQFKVHGKGTKGDPPFGSFPVGSTPKGAQDAFDTCEGEGFKALKAWIRGAATIHDIARKQLGGQANEGNPAKDTCGSSSEETVSRYTNCLIEKFKQLRYSVQRNSPVPSKDDYCGAAKAVAMVEGWTSFTDRTSTIQAKQPGLIIRSGFIYLERVVKPVGGSLAKFVIEENPIQKPPIVKNFENRFECWLLLAGLNKKTK